MDFTQGDIDSLAEKLAGAGLTEGERAVMDALVDAATGEVAGFVANVGLSFAPLKPAEFLLAHEVTHARHGTPDATNVHQTTPGHKYVDE